MSSHTSSDELVAITYSTNLTHIDPITEMMMVFTKELLIIPYKFFY